MNILDFVKIETSTVDDGNMDYDKSEREKVLSNRKKFFNRNSLNYDNTYEMVTNDKVFNKVKVVNRSPNNMTFIKQTDSLISNNPNVVLALTSADCLPITVYDFNNRVLALIHAGLKWQDAGIIDRTFEALENRYDTKVSDVLVHLGNCISPENYRWDNNILNITNEGSWIRKTIKKDNHPKRPYIIDIRRAAILNLNDIGVLHKNILDSDINCYSDMRYFSHVRSVYSDEKDGRHITLVQMR